MPLAAAVVLEGTHYASNNDTPLDALPITNDVQQRIEVGDFMGAAYALNALRDVRHDIRHRIIGGAGATEVVRDVPNTVSNPGPDLRLIELQKILATLAAAKLLLAPASQEGPNQDDLDLNFLASVAYRMLITEPDLSKKPGRVTRSINAYLLTHLRLRLNLDEKQARQRLLLARDFAVMQQPPVSVTTRYNLEIAMVKYAVIETTSTANSQNLGQVLIGELDAIEQGQSNLPDWFTQLPSWQQALVKEVIPQVKQGAPIPGRLKELFPVGARGASCERKVKVFQAGDGGVIVDKSKTEYLKRPAYSIDPEKLTDTVDNFSKTVSGLHTGLNPLKDTYADQAWHTRHKEIISKAAKSGHACMAAAYGNSSTPEFDTSKASANKLPKPQRSAVKRYFVTPLARFSTSLPDKFSKKRMAKFEQEWGNASMGTPQKQLIKQKALIKHILSERKLRTGKKSFASYYNRETSREKMQLLMGVCTAVEDATSVADIAQAVADAKAVNRKVSHQRWARSGSTGSLLAAMKKTVASDRVGKKDRDFGRHHSLSLQKKAFKQEYTPDAEFDTKQKALIRLVSTIADNTWAQASYWSKHNTPADCIIRDALKTLIDELGKVKVEDEDEDGLKTAVVAAYSKVTDQLPNTKLGKHEVGKLLYFMAKHMDLDLRAKAAEHSSLDLPAVAQ